MDILIGIYKKDGVHPLVSYLPIDLLFIFLYINNVITLLAFDIIVNAL